MTDRQVFGLALRIAGLIVVLGMLGNPWRFVHFWTAVVSVPPLALGVYLVRGAPRILEFSYPSAKGTNEDHAG